MKKCSTCRALKDISEYHKKTRNCKECVKAYYQSRKEIVKAKSKTYHAKNREACNIRSANWKINNKEKKEAYEVRTKEAKQIKHLEYCKNNLEKRKETSKKSYQKNKEKRLKYNREYRLKRSRKDDLFKVKEKLRARIKSFFYKIGSPKKNTSTLSLIGGSFEMAKQHIESQFKEGMSWENHGQYGWHIDHKIPLASVKTEAELLPLFHYTNLQPLWALDNIKKGAKIINT